MAEHGEHGKRMDELEEQWLELQGSLEEIGQPKPDGKRRGDKPLLDCRSMRLFDINNYYHLYFVANLALTADRAGVMSTLTDVFLRHYRELLGFLSLRTGSRDVPRTAPMTPGSSWRNSVTARARTMTAPTSSASPPISPPTGTVGAAAN